MTDTATSPTPHVDIPLPKHVLRALMGATGKNDVRKALNYLALDTLLPGEPPTLVASNGHIMTVYPLDLPKDDAEALRVLTEGKTVLFRPMQAASAAPATLRVLPGGFVQVRPSTGAAAGAWLPSSSPTDSFPYPDWRLSDAFRREHDDEWMLGSGPVGLDISLLHAVWPGGWVLRHHEKWPGQMRATPHRNAALNDPPAVQVTFMGQRI